MKQLAIISAIISSLVMILLWVLGFFTTLIIQNGHEGGYELAGYVHEGPYKTLGKSFERLDSTAESLGLHMTDRVGLYYNNPNDVHQDSLLSFVAVVMAEEGFAIGNMDLADLMQESIPYGQAIYIDFPSDQPLSHLIGPLRCYPLLNDRAEAEGWVSSTVFELHGSDYIRYVMLR